MPTKDIVLNTVRSIFVDFDQATAEELLANDYQQHHDYNPSRDYRR
jgi:hypothetical protein